MSPRFTFQRRIRTQSSEQYNIYDSGVGASNQQAVGQIDVHYLSATQMEVSLILFEERQREEIEELLAALDDDLLFSAGFEARQAHVIVFTGEEMGLYEFQADAEASDDELGPTEEADVV